jgi:uncharacterized protein involved in oxidation of intracellular sulfur
MPGGIKRMKTLLILNNNPYNGTDVTRNALRLAEQLLNIGVEVELFLLNDSVDLAREGVSPGQYDTNLGDLLSALINKGVSVKACLTCLSRCGLAKNKPLLHGVKEGKMPELALLIKEADKVVSF